ncbi:MAG: PD40 domain-containing protein [Deltaproteobacteria bacterium]|nr:PD40 domain-containing protein [Deltaproteobacteria bacterium]
MKKYLLSLTVIFIIVMSAFNPANSAEPNGGRSPVHSPDGSKIAFLSSTLHTPADLWVMNADGSGKRRLTTRGVSHFRWAPDGKTILFSARRKGYEEVLRIGIDGGRPEERIPGIPPNAGIPIESPDGKLFAFTAPGEQQNVRDLWIGTSDGSRVEAVTEKISVRSVFFSPDSRKVYYEAGKTYGVGIWEIDLSDMESKPLLNKYIGTPAYSNKAGLIAYPFPTSPGEFEIRTMDLSGKEVTVLKAPRLAGRRIAWDVDGKGIFYIGQDIEIVPADNAVAADNTAGAKVDDDREKPRAPHETRKSGNRQVGVNALWRLDMASGIERRISPPELHLSDFSLSPGGKDIVLAGVSERSGSAELYLLDGITGSVKPLAKSRPSAWMPVPSPDATKVAFFTNEGGVEFLKVAGIAGEESASYPGFALEGDTRIFWLPRSEGLLVFSARGLHAFSEKGPIDFPNNGDLRSYLDADASIQDDKVLVSAIPRYGETPGLYMLTASDNAFRLSDLRYPSAPEVAAELYLQPKWSNDGKKIAFTDGVDVWTMKGDGTGRVRVTSFAESNKGEDRPPSTASHPFWSAAGKKIGYTFTVYDGKKVVRELIASNADGTETKKLHSSEVDSQFQVFQPEYTHRPFFDATDEHVIFTALHNGIPNVFAVKAEGGQPAPLTETGAIFPALLPEEGTIVYVSLDENDERLFVMNSDGSDKRPFFLKPAQPGRVDPAAKE